MNAFTFQVEDDVRGKIEKIATERGVSIDTLLSEMANHMVSEFEAHRLFVELSKRGKDNVPKALELLNRL